MDAISNLFRAILFGLEKRRGKSLHEIKHSQVILISTVYVIKENPKLCKLVAILNISLKR